MNNNRSISTQITHWETGEKIDARVLRSLSVLDVMKTERIWGPIRLDAMISMIEDGIACDQMPEHLHWNWDQKTHDYQPDRHEFLGIECESEIQALMRINTRSELARVAVYRGRPIVYVDFLEAAPWNSRQFQKTPRFKLTGLRMIETAAFISKEIGYDGIVGLHALPQVRAFYENACEMQSYGFDGEHEGLEYFELPFKVAQRWLRGNS